MFVIWRWRVNLIWDFKPFPNPTNQMLSVEKSKKILGLVYKVYNFPIWRRFVWQLSLIKAPFGKGIIYWCTLGDPLAKPVFFLSWIEHIEDLAAIVWQSSSRTSSSAFKWCIELLHNHCCILWELISQLLWINCVHDPGFQTFSAHAKLYTMSPSLP